jgi:hypothetical protein
MTRFLLGAAVVCLLIAATPSSSVAADCRAGTGAKIVDVAVVRLLSVPVAFVTSGIYTGLSPLLHLMGVSEPAADYLVLGPWRFTSFREVGCFGTYRDGLNFVER